MEFTQISQNFITFLHKTAIKHENYYKGVAEKCTFYLKELESIIINTAISFMRRVYFIKGSFNEHCENLLEMAGLVQ